MGERTVDGQRVTLPIGKIAAAVLVSLGILGAAVWWAATMQGKLDSLVKATDGIAKSLDLLSSLTEKASRNEGRIDEMAANVNTYKRELETMQAWIMTTRIELAKKGFETRDYQPYTKGGS